MQKFWMMDPGKARVSIMGEIGMADDGYGINASYEAFREDMKALEGAKEIEVVIDSPGGSLFAGRSIYTALKDSGAKIHVRLLSEASSAASLIACAGDTVSALSCTMALIHRCHCFFCEPMDARALQAQVQTMEAFDRNAAEIYAKRSRKCSADEFLSMMDEGKHLTAKELVEIGLVDVIEDEASESDMEMKREFKKRIELMMEKSNATMADEIQPGTDEEKKPTPPAPDPEKKDPEESLEDVVKALTEKVAALEKKVAELEGDKERIKEIDENAEMFSDTKMLFDAKYNSKITMAELAVKELQLQREQKKAFAMNRAAELQNSGVNDVINEGTVEPALNEERSASKDAEMLMLGAIKEINSKRGL